MRCSSVDKGLMGWHGLPAIAKAAIFKGKFLWDSYVGFHEFEYI